MNLKGNSALVMTKDNHFFHLGPWHEPILVSVIQIFGNGSAMIHTYDNLLKKLFPSANWQELWTQASSCLCFSSLENIYGTFFAEALHVPESPVKIFLTVSPSSFSYSVIICTLIYV